MELQTHGVRKYPPTSALLASSAGLGWSTVSVELRSHGVSEVPAIVPQHVEICLVVAGNKDGLVRRTGAGFCQEAMPKTGAIWLSPAGVGKEIVITAPIPQTMHLYITLVDLAGVAGYSPFHFARKFTLAMGISPHRYRQASAVKTSASMGKTEPRRNAFVSILSFPSFRPSSSSVG